MRLDARHVAPVLTALSVHQDAGETAVFTRQLQYVYNEGYEMRYPELRARQLIPLDTSVPEGAESFVTRFYDWAGMAKIISDFADDLPMVNVMAAEVAQLCKTIGQGYDYSVQELAAASMPGAPRLDTLKAKYARRAFENAIEQLAAKGNAAAGLPGFVNNANVPLITTTELVGGWTTATSAEILSDLHIIANTMVTTTKNVWVPDTLILPTSRYSVVASKAYSDTIPDTILSVFLKTNPYIRNIDQWYYLDTADAAGTGPRAVAYKRDPEVVRLVIPKDFTQLPPQARNLAFVVPTYGRIGGVSVRNPLGMLYADDI